MAFLGIENETVLMLLAAVGGALMRMLFGLWKAFSEKRYVAFDWKRIVIEIIASVGFGMFALLGMETFKIGFLPKTINAAVTAVAGFWGADLLNLMSKRIGITTIQTAFQRAIPGLNERQMKALDYLAIRGSITNDAYQELTGSSDSTASRDLAQLAKKGLIKRSGSGRGSKYTF